MSSAITIRAFTQSDVPFGMELKRLAGWNQLEADWRRFLALQPDGCFVAEAGSVPAGTATTTQYGLRLGWVGMVLVLPQMRRRGVGTALLRHCIDDLEARGVACVKLDATPLGKKLYDTLGFVDEYLLARWQAAATPPVGPRSDEVQPLGPDDVAELSEYDGPVFGADRREHLALLIDQGPGGCFLHRNERGHIDGYLCSRPGANAAQIGPWVAEDAAAGEALLVAGLGPLAGEAVFLDVPMARPGPSALVGRYGFETQRPLIRMYRGENAHPGDPARVFAFCGPETG